MEVDRKEYERLSGSRGSEELCLQDVSGEENDECPDNHLRMSLLALLCCFPCGIVALHHSLQVNRLYSRGRVQRAIQSSERAEVCSVRALTCMLLFCTCQLMLFLAGLVLLICFAFDCDRVVDSYSAQVDSLLAIQLPSLLQLSGRFVAAKMEEEIDEPLHRKGAPENYHRRSLLAVLLCCPFGICSLYNSLKVNQLFNSGKEMEAQRSSRRAVTFSSWAFVAAVITAVIFVFLLIAGFVLLISFAFDWNH